MVQSSESMVDIGLFQSNKVLSELDSGPCRVKVRGDYCFVLFFFSNDIFLTFLENYWTRAYDYTNCNALLYPVIYESVHLCTLPVQLLSWAIISKLLFRDELCHAGKWDKKNVNEHAWMLVDEG